MIEVLRPYQTAAIDALRAGIVAGHRSQLLVAPTGAGKTVIASQLLYDAINRKNRAGETLPPTSTAFMVDRIVLVDQTSRTLDRYGIPHGVVQAGHWRYRPNEPIQICSAQTIEKRGFFPGCKLLIVDEAHVVRKQTADLIRNRHDIRVVGLTATPFSKGLKELYSNLVNVTTTERLQTEGWLVNLLPYAAKAIDMAGAKTIGGEWADREVESRGLKIIGDILAEWVDKTNKHFGGPVKTIVFSATVDHGAEICRQFQEAGFNFQQISYKDTNDDRRRELIEEFGKLDSTIMGLVACEVLTKGFDVPDVMCGIAARPYRKSLSSHIQQIGRVLRPAPGKEFALWLDHGGNYLRFQEDTDTVFANGVQSFDDGALDAKIRPEPTEKVKSQIKCAACGFVMPPMADTCPACGMQRLRRSMVENVAGEMVLIAGKRVEASGKYAYLADRVAVWHQLAWMGLHKKGDDIAAAQRWAQAKYHAIYGDFARRKVNALDAKIPCEELQRKIQSDNIRWAKRRNAA